jgi:Tfp pilus assembly protein PilF
MDQIVTTASVLFLLACLFGAYRAGRAVGYAQSADHRRRLLRMLRTYLEAGQADKARALIRRALEVDDELEHQVDVELEHDADGL